ncbi:MAG: ABC transporter permease DevC [Pseudomonadota bacterium]
MIKIPVGWLQLKRERARLVIAVLGVGFAVVLVLMQMGFREAMLDSAVRYHQLWHYDIALISPETAFLVKPQPFSHRRLYQAAAMTGVESVTPLYAMQSRWKDPRIGDTRDIFTLGIHPEDSVFQLDAIHKQQSLLKKRDFYLFDRLSRPEFDPIAQQFAELGYADMELNGQTVTIAGLFELGPSFGIDGSLITNVDSFLELVPERGRGKIDIGLIRLAPTKDVNAVAKALREYLPNDVEVLPRADFIAREIDYWNASTPIGYVFNFGILVGLVVGAIIVYQILHADVSDHLPEYATLKAMGYSNTNLAGIVGLQAFILALLGFLLGTMVALALYRVTASATLIQLTMTPGRAAIVLALTLGMCIVSGVMALRKVRAADPADVF